MIEIELSRSAAAALRSLPRAQQSVVADRVALLADVRAPSGDTPLPGPFVLEAGEHRLVCAWRRPDRVLIAAIEVEGAGAVGAVRVASRAFVGRVMDTEPAAPRRTRSLRGQGSRRRRMQVMDLLLELRLAARALRRDLGIVLLAVLVLGVGIGLPTAVFGLLDAAVLRGLAVPEGDRIVHLERRPHGASGEGWGVSAREVEMWGGQQRTLTSLEAMNQENVTIRVGNASYREEAVYVTGGAFRALDLPASMGRVFSDDDVRPGAPATIVVSHDFWTDRLSADPEAIGRVLQVDGVQHTLIGVMPDGFAFPTNQGIWLPLSLEALLARDPSTPVLSGFGRLARGASLEDAQTDFGLIGARAEAGWPETNENIGVAVKPFTARMMGESPSQTLFVVLAMVLLVLVVACANVANLLLVRAVRRMRDVAVRSALGATRARLAMQTLLESLLLAAAGGLAGVAVAAIVLGLFRRSFGYRLPAWAEFRIDGTMLLFVAILTIVAAVLAGLLPALRGSAGDLSRTLRDESRGATGVRVGRIMRGLVVIEMALSVALVAATGLLLRSAREASADSIGVPYDGILTAAVALPDGTPAEQVRQYFSGLEREIAAQPGVEAVTLATGLPATRGARTRFALEGVEYTDYDAQPTTRWVAVDDGFFAMFGAAPEQGRRFGPEDATGTPTAVVNRAFVRRFLEGGDPIGRRLRIGRAENADWRTIVGVVPDLWAAGLDASPPDRNPPAVYVPLVQAAPTGASIAVRVAGQTEAFTPALRAAASTVDPDVPLYAVGTMESVIADNNWFYGMAALIFALCGGAALVLTAAGLYGVIAYSVSQRAREFGIRMAMGAEPEDIQRMVVRNGSGQLILGIAAGLILAFGATRGVASLLFDVRPSDPLVLGATTALLLVIALAAMLVPARRAARADPLEALRGD